MRKLIKFLRSPFLDKLNILHYFWRMFVGIIYYRRIFASFGSGSILYKPMLLGNTRFIHIGKNVQIRQGARLETVVIDPANPPELRIEDNVSIEQDVHIVVLGKMTIGRNVSIAPRCTFNCGAHPFRDVNDSRRIGDRLEGKDSFLIIGQDSFIGAGCVFQMNVELGAYAVIGSNAVVNQDIPSYSVAAGNPARVMMVYNKEDNCWV